MADYDGDGLSNIMEFVLGGNPTVAQTGLLPVCTVSTVGSTTNLVFDYDRVVDTSGATVTFEYSTDLTTWTTAVDGQAGVTVVTSAPVAGVEHVTVTVPMGAPANRAFGRLKITL